MHSIGKSNNTINQFGCLQVQGRSILFVVLSYCFGNGIFWTTMFFIFMHIVIITSVRLMNRTLKFKEKFEVKTVFNSFMIALTNVYCSTWVLYNRDRQQKEDNSKTPKNKAVTREILLLVLFMSENSLFLMIMTYYYYVIGNIHWILFGLAVYSYVSHILGAFLRAIYVKNYHVWRELMWKDFWSMFEKDKTDNSDDDSDTEQTEEEETTENDGTKMHSNNKNRPISYIFPPMEEIRNGPLTPP